MKRSWVFALLSLAGLGLGIGLGLVAGWLWWPVEYTDTEIIDLEESFRADYVVMVSDTYALTGDLNAARERLNRLGAPDPAALVASRAEAAIAAGGAEDQIGNLARLAAALGASNPALRQYLAPPPVP